MVTQARTFRTRLPLRIAVLLAAALWGGVLAALLGARGSAEPQAVLGAAAFLALFAGFSFAYGRTWITVTAGGLVAATPFRVRPVPFDDIEEIVVQDGLAGRAYAIVTRRGLVRFTSLLDHHRELFEVLLEQARLTPQRS
jgi:hypothetical protein